MFSFTRPPSLTCSPPPLYSWMLRICADSPWCQFFSLAKRGPFTSDSNFSLREWKTGQCCDIWQYWHCHIEFETRNCSLEFKDEIDWHSWWLNLVCKLAGVISSFYSCQETFPCLTSISAGLPHLGLALLGQKKQDLLRTRWWWDNSLRM